MNRLAGSRMVNTIDHDKLLGSKESYAVFVRDDMFVPASLLHR